MAEVSLRKRYKIYFTGFQLMLALFIIQFRSIPVAKALPKLDAAPCRGDWLSEQTLLTH